MIYKARYIFFFVTFIIGLACDAAAQAGFYVPAKGKVFFKGDTATIFSNVHNAGKVGVGKHAVVNFKGKKWENEATAMITDESDGGEGAAGTGGLVRFIGENAVQQLDGGYNSVTRNGATFSFLQVNNPYGLQLTGSTTKVRHELQLANGHLFLQNNILVIGDGKPGAISGYDASRYIVTGNAPGNGLLIREHITGADGIVVFPIGSNINAYTPAAIRTSSSLGDDYYMNVFDGVLSQVTTGINQQLTSVNKTWETGKLQRPGEDETEIFLQHLVRDEGAFFNAGRQFSYISAYVNGKWDTSMPQQLPLPGILTGNGVPLANSGLNSRTVSGIGSASYFTKFSGFNVVSPIRTQVWLSAYRTDWEHVNVYWSTRPEINNQYFVVQRRLSNEADFRNVDTVLTKTRNGLSFDYLHYSMTDPNKYMPLSYYRLMLVDRQGSSSYSNIVAVNGVPGGYQLLLWPNPSTGVFYVGVNGAAAVKSVVVWDVQGRKIQEVTVNARTIIEMRLFIPGTYMVGFISHSGKILETKKLIIKPF